MNEYRGISEFGTEQQVSGLFDAKELVGTAAAVSLQKTDPSKWKVWPRRKQKSSSSCVYQARAKAGGILREQKGGKYVEMTAAAYAERSNKPQEGSSPIEAFEKWRKEGLGLEHLEPSQNMGEAQMNALKQGEFEKQVAAVSRIPAYAGLTGGDFDHMLSTLIATGKPIPFGFYASQREWNDDVEVMEIKDNVTLGTAYARHEVCATPNVGIWNGVPGFTFEDSAIAGIDGKGVLWMSREFFEKRNYIPGLYATTFVLEQGGPVKPSAKLTRELEFGMSGPDVARLQAVYRFEGLFPANHVGSDYFGNITKDCTQKYQTRYGIAGPTTPGYGRVGPITMADINTRYP